MISTAEKCLNCPINVKCMTCPEMMRWVREQRKKNEQRVKGEQNGIHED